MSERIDSRTMIFKAFDIPAESPARELIDKHFSELRSELVKLGYEPQRVDHRGMGTNDLEIRFYMKRS
jgi:hypothetical protein